MKKTMITFLMSMAALPILSTTPAEIGDKVPDFEAIDDKGNTWRLSDQRSDYLVVYFFPAAFTGGCTMQACQYRDRQSRFALLNTRVVGISGDSPENLASFREHHGLNFTLLSDEEGEIAELFGVPSRDGGTTTAETNGQMLLLTRGVTTARWTFVIDVNGKLIYQERDVNAREDTGTVLEFISLYEKRRSCAGW